MSSPSSPDRPYSAGDPPPEPTLIFDEPTPEPESRTTETPMTETPMAETPMAETPMTETTEAPAFEAWTDEASATDSGTPAEPLAAPTIAADAVPVAGPVFAPDALFRRGIRMRTVVFGLVLLAIAGSVLVGQLTDLTVDAGLVFLGLMIGCGVLLIAGARRS